MRNATFSATSSPLEVAAIALEANEGIAYPISCRQVCEPGGKAGMLERLDHFRQTVPLKRMAMRLPITAIAIRALRQAPSGGIQCNRDGRFYAGDRSYTCLVDAKADRVAQRHDDGVCFRRIEGGIWLVASHPCG